jgi:hypothetical protein
MTWIIDQFLGDESVSNLPMVAAVEEEKVVLVEGEEEEVSLFRLFCGFMCDFGLQQVARELRCCCTLRAHELGVLVVRGQCYCFMVQKDIRENGVKRHADTCPLA